jgi:histidine triad (HIT) family protein
MKETKPAAAECVFCKILRGETTAEILFRNKHTIAILDINPIHYGHILVIPKSHAVTFLEVPEEELADLMYATRKVTEAMVESLDPPGYNIFSNNGEAAGQSVFHCHFHITPRYRDDNIRFLLKLKRYEGDDMKRYAERIRATLGNPLHESKKEVD